MSSKTPAKSAGQTDTPSLNDAEMEPLGGLDWLEQELRAKAARSAAKPVPPAAAPALEGLDLVSPFEHELPSSDISSKAAPARSADQTEATPLNRLELEPLESLNWLEEELRAKDVTAAKPAPPTAAPALEDHHLPNPPKHEPPSSEKSTQYLIFELQARRYALPVANLVEVGRPTNMTAAGSSPDWVAGHSKLRGDSLAVVDLRRFLGLGTRAIQSSALVVVRSLREGVQIGLLVDEVREVAAVPENAEPCETPTPGKTQPFLQPVQFAGQVLTIVDPEQLLLSPQMHPLASPAGSSVPPASSTAAQGSDGISDRVADTFKHARRTAEHSKEMTALVHMIRDMTEQTRLLAVNASIKAAAAGVAGQDFGVIAGEVERLADRCAYSSRQLLAVVESIESETTAVASGLDAAARDIANLSQSAARAEGCLSGIEGAATTFSSVVQTISHAAEAQARTSAIAAKAIDDMLSNLRQMERSVSEAGQTAGSFSALTSDLKSSIQGLKGQS